MDRGVTPYLQSIPTITAPTTVPLDDPVLADGVGQLPSSGPPTSVTAPVHM